MAEGVNGDSLRERNLRLVHTYYDAWGYRVDGGRIVELWHQWDNMRA
jgi:hypothetical protein